MNGIGKKGLAVIATVASLGFVSSAEAIQVFGLSTRNQLVSFDSSAPGSLMSANFINGMASNESMLGIDFRPATGGLYGLGSFGNLYTLNTLTGQATLVAALTDSLTGNPLSLSGVEFGFDFNPTVDRIRVTSDLDQNLRINPLTGVTVIDGSLNGSTNPNIVASAYTNNDNDPATGTTLYNIDSATDMLTIQTPPNNGTQVNVGSLGLDVTALAGMDIYTQGTTNTAFAALQIAGTQGSSFFNVNLTTGSLTALGGIGNSQSRDSLAIRDIAVTPVPEPATMAVLGLGAAALLRRRKK